MLPAGHLPSANDEADGSSKRIVLFQFRKRMAGLIGQQFGMSAFRLTDERHRFTPLLQRKMVGVGRLEKCVSLCRPRCLQACSW